MTHFIDKNGNEIEVCIPNELKSKINDEAINNMVDQADEKTVRINIDSLSQNPKAINKKSSTDTVRTDLYKSTSKNGIVQPDAWYDLYSITTVNRGYYYTIKGPKKVVCTVGEGQSTTIQYTKTFTESYSISGTVNAAARASLTAAYDTSSSYTVSVGTTYNGPPEDPNRIVTRYHYTAPMLNMYNFSWKEVGFPSGDVYGSGSGFYYEPDYWVNWSEDKVL